MIMKKNILKLMNPLEIVNSLNGRGVNPAVKSIPSQERKPPFEENFSFRKFGSSYPYNSIIYEEWDGIIGAHNIMSESSRYLLS